MSSTPRVFQLVASCAFFSLFALRAAGDCDVPPFSIATQLPVGGPSLNILTADFNNDSKADLAVTNESQVMVFLGDGSGAFSPAAAYNAGRLPRGMAVGDLDNDGRTDLVVVNLNNISVLLNNGTGGFKAPLDYSAGTGPNAVGTGDFNGDGNLDAAVVNRDSDDVTILLGDGKGGFGDLVRYPAGELPLSIAIGDYDGDGRLDLAISTYASQEIRILRGDGLGGFITLNSYPVGGNASRIIADDFNHDNILDLAVGVYNIYPNNHMAVFLGHGDGTFTESADIPAPDPQGLASADFNGDNNVDLISTNYYFPTLVLGLGDGTGNFSAPHKTRLQGSPLPLGIVTGNFNGDEKPDLALSNYDSLNATILLNIPRLQVQAADATASEATGDKGQFQIFRTGCFEEPQVVHYTVRGSARPGVDYKSLPGVATIPAGARSVSVPVIPLQQPLSHDSATVILTIDPDPAYVAGRNSAAMVVITNN